MRVLRFHKGLERCHSCRALRRGQSSGWHLKHLVVNLRKVALHICRGHHSTLVGFIGVIERCGHDYVFRH
eukprot:scaffold417992_cov67-Attheya_sp.AAC.2